MIWSTLVHLHQLGKWKKIIICLLYCIIPFICCCSVAQSCLIICKPTDFSTTGFPVLRYLPEFAQTHVHWIGDCHPTISSSVVALSSRLQSFPASGSFPMSQFFAWGSQSKNSKTNLYCWKSGFMQGVGVGTNGKGPWGKFLGCWSCSISWSRLHRILKIPWAVQLGVHFSMYIIHQYNL